MKSITRQTDLTAIDELIDLIDSRFFKALSEPVRVQLMKYLILSGKSDIASIAAAFPQDRSVISRHLQAMLEVGLLRREKVSRYVYYEIDGETVLDRFERISAKIRQSLPQCCPPGK
ncbi:MAG: metalloregulator ArsR/SmtB family transcription factor [Desulfobacterales bacterium]|jgi:DNA-binding transcriptional ArsR family regulator